MTRLDGSQLTINCDLVETIEQTPDTVISLVTNRKYVVRETVEEIIGRVIEYRRRVQPCPLVGQSMPPAWLQGLHDGHPFSERS